MSELALSRDHEEADTREGWKVVAATHVLTAVTFGGAYSFSATLPGLAAEFSASRGEIALVFSISAFLFYSLGAIAGPLADRWSPRNLNLLGLAAMILGYIGASRAGSLLSLYIWYGFGVGFGIGLSYVPALGAVQSWFVRKRSLASGIATAGIGLGTLILPFAVGQALPSIGWRGCFIALACIVAGFGLPAAMLMRKRRDNNQISSNSGANASVIWRDSRFYLFYLVLILSSFCTFIPYVHIVAAAQDLGLSIQDGTTLVGLIGVGNVIGRFFLAGLGDRLGRRRLLASLTFAVAASFALWATASGMVQLALFALTFGMSYGGCVGLYPAVAADLFGTRNIGAVIGYLYTAVGIAALIGPTGAGFIFDHTGSYFGPIVASGLAALLAGFLALRLGPK
ncbi:MULTISPECIES: MFS transporter [unclassified Rhizobium]|jgi:OFA family oxalate/formate antiporter-like MFS transporter|uniref:MFS transporter n=1 Tax=unclassified Rhizobium TaxID=2613769 RepID=UPI000646F103|nr:MULTISPECIES: MFS transporter [unclassified Rhizobium]MBN8953026.1 MFS transporter [Rhizobium tropici]OJY64646.1 MAG: MFS transporter [Rhizobium sp. 60-20]RKD72492.1 cyanate permease [Rhizobium sp. WW_1]